jgi:CheY-like chemotaxis protein
MAQKILFIDDDSYVQLWVDAAKEAGYQTRQSYTTDEAYQEAETWKPDLVVLDIMMPPGTRYAHRKTQNGLRSGLFLLEDLRALDPDLPVLVLTNVRDDETLRQFDSFQSLKIVQKRDSPPFDFVEEIELMLRETER